METLVKVNSSRGGRDKVFRTLQYCLKAINSRPYLATNETRNLEKTLASFRKLLRLGTFIDVLHGARQSMHHHSSLLTGAILTLSKTANAMYLFGDHLIWIHRSEFLVERKFLAKIIGVLGNLLGTTWSKSKISRNGKSFQISHGSIQSFSTWWETTLNSKSITKEHRQWFWTPSKIVQISGFLWVL